MINVTCELCNEFLPFFQFSKLCPVCYKIRTIVKAYDSTIVLKNLEKHFLVHDNHVSSNTLANESDDQKDYDKPKRNVKINIAK